MMNLGSVGGGETGLMLKHQTDELMLKEAEEEEENGTGYADQRVVFRGCRDQLWLPVCSFGNELCDPAQRCVMIPTDLPLGE